MVVFKLVTYPALSDQVYCQPS